MRRQSEPVEETLGALEAAADRLLAEVACYRCVLVNGGPAPVCPYNLDCPHRTAGQACQPGPLALSAGR